MDKEAVVHPRQESGDLKRSLTNIERVIFSEEVAPGGETASSGEPLLTAPFTAPARPQGLEKRGRCGEAANSAWAGLSAGLGDGPPGAAVGYAGSQSALKSESEICSVVSDSL